MSATIFIAGIVETNPNFGTRGGIGVYWSLPDHRLNVSEPILGCVTNNRARIQAAIRAMRDARTNGCTSVDIYTDSCFVFNAVTAMVTTWLQSGFQMLHVNPDEITAYDFEELDAARSDMEVHWFHVQGQLSTSGNIAANSYEANNLAIAGLAGCAWH